MIKPVKPVEVPDPKTRSSKVEHPAFGQITASRVSAAPGAILYGSDFKHNRFIEITVSESELERDISHDWHFARKRVLQIAMSESQWAEFVSSLNVGEGVPCTIEWTESGARPPIADPVDRRSQFMGEVEERLQIANDALDKMALLVMDLKISQKAREALNSEIHSARMNISPNVKYVAKRFDEHVEQTLNKARSEINAYAHFTLRDLPQLEGDSPVALLGAGEKEETD